MGANSKLVVDDFFLSSTNPVANADQRALDELCIRIFNTPEIAAAKERAKARWRGHIGNLVDDQAYARLDKMLGDEWAFQKIIKSVGSDANYPKVMSHLWTEPHTWFGMNVPGSRAADNPDNTYAIIPISYYGRYELHGRKLSDEIDCPFQLVSNTPMTTTLAQLDWPDVKFEADGSFLITLDSDPADGRPNHIRTTLDSRYLLLRHSRSDWTAMPNAYRVKRLNAPTADPFTFEQFRDRAAIWMVEDVPANYWWVHNLSANQLNVPTPVFSTADIGGMATQRAGQNRIRIADDEAYVVTTRHGGATYRGMLLFDGLARTTDNANHLGSLNNSQSIPDSEDETTYVASIQDPGVHNWIDTQGQHQVFLLHRWQGLPADAPLRPEGWMRGEVVKLKDLDRVVPKTMARVTAAERAAQLAERKAAFNLRYLDH